VFFSWCRFFPFFFLFFLAQSLPPALLEPSATRSVRFGEDRSLGFSVLFVFGAPPTLGFSFQPKEGDRGAGLESPEPSPSPFCFSPFCANWLVFFGFFSSPLFFAPEKRLFSEISVFLLFAIVFLSSPVELPTAGFTPSGMRDMASADAVVKSFPLCGRSFGLPFFFLCFVPSPSQCFFSVRASSTGFFPLDLFSSVCRDSLLVPPFSPGLGTRFPDWQRPPADP